MTLQSILNEINRYKYLTNSKKLNEISNHLPTLTKEDYLWLMEKQANAQS